MAHIEATILNDEGKFLKEYGSEKTRQTSSHEKVMGVIEDFAKRFPEYDKITAGFRGYIKWICRFFGRKNRDSGINYIDTVGFKKKEIFARRI